jgi:hypothetical protein
MQRLNRRDPSILNAEAEVGHHSAGWCNLSNIAFRCGRTYSHAEVKTIPDASGIWAGLLGEMDQLLRAHHVEIASDEIKLSPLLELDPESEKFTGHDADAANGYLKRSYRAPFVVPEVVA